MLIGRNLCLLFFLICFPFTQVAPGVAGNKEQVFVGFLAAYLEMEMKTE